MASRNRGTFRPSNSLPIPKQPKSKAKQQKQEQCEFEVKVVGGINESSTSNSKVSLQDLVKKLKESFSGNSRETLKPSKPATDENKQYVKCKLLVRGVSPKHSAFYNIRKTWFGNICQAGDPFWLESCEEARNSYRFQANVQRHSFDPVSCSLGSFLNRGTFVEHYNTEVDRYSMDDQSLYAEFQHDTKVLEISCYILTIIEFRLAFEYKQFENYVLVDEKQRGVVDIYIPLLRPPKVIKLERQLGKDRADEVRCVEFLSCSQEILGKSCVLKLSFESSDKPSELVTRLAKMSRTIYFCAVNTILPLDQVLKKPSFTDFRTAYALECLLSRGFKVSDRLTSRFYQMLKEASGSTSYLSMVSRRGRQLSSSQICRALYQLIAFVEANRFCPLETILEQLLFGKFKKNVAIDLEIPKHYVYVPRIIITPTQNYLVQPELVAENRVIREFGHEFAMRIAFREEDFSKLTSFSESLKDVLDVRVIGFLREGIHLCGRHFKFLACSNSQLRDHGAWLFAYDGQVEAEEIRKSLGKLDGIRCVATYVSRMGQCFSSTKESVKITMDEGVETAEIPDISKDYKDEYFACCQKLRSGTYTFSDGIGKISQLLAKKIAKSLDLKTVPSAFQIRYAGCKGMLAIDTSLPKDRQILQYRKSMRKFDSEHEGLEICEHSKPNALYLNRQCITLLSGMGVPDEALIKLQDTMLIRLASMLLFESVALETLGQTSVPGGLKAKALRNSGIMVTCEPFFRSLLLAIYKSKLNDLLRRARIAIPHAHGRLLIGVLDESQTLQYGQVFIRYSKDISEPNKEYVTLTGQVVVTKNPCFHPGDLRKFEAVDVKSLYHLVDCIVFPSRGPRPHTDEISGSDLDGDKYFATWYKPLIPPQPNAPPMDFLSPEKRVLDRKVEVDDMIQFVAEYIKNDQLGVIANAHLVHADSEDDGVKSDKCITLAHMHSDAVDFPKTGQCPSLTSELRPEQYPDFMMKTDKPRYKSKKVIGKLFQKCNQLERARYFMASEETEDQEQVRVDQDLVVPGHEEFMVSALESRDRYNTKLGSLMALYGLKDEGEVLTGCLTKVNSRLSGKTDEKFEVAQLIQASLASLRNNLKVEFYQEFGSEEDVKDYFQEHKEYPQDVLCKASAWYVVTYSSIDAQPAASQDATQTTEEDPGLADEWSMSNKPLLSFPWIVSPLLAYIKSQCSMETSAQKTVEPHKELENISKLIIAQTKQMFSKENLRELMTEDFQARHIWRDELPNCSPMSLLGASMTGLNILDKKVQPMQLYCHVRWDTTTEIEVACLRKYEGFLRRSRIISKHLFIGKYGYNDHCMGLSFTTGQDKKHYIVANPFEMLKSFYIQTHIMQAPLLLPLLMVIMHWARKRYMTGSARDSFIAVEDLAVLFIKYCEHSQYIEEIQLEELKLKANKFLKNKEEGENLWKNTILESMEFTNQGFFVEPGLTLIKFWEFYGSDSRSDALHLSKIRNPVNPREKLLSYLKQEESQRFTDAALHTFHEIAQRRGLDSLLTSIEHENLKEVSETLTMPNCTWGSLRFAEDFVAHGLSTLTKAKVNIRSAHKGGGYIMEVVGNYISLSRCQAECHRLEAKTREHFVYDHVIRSGNRFIFLDQTSHDDLVAARKLKKGDFAVNLTSTSPTGIQIDEIKLLSAVKEQMDVYQNSYLSYLHGSKNLHISLEYGSIFVTNAHKWVAGTTVEDVEETLSKKSNAKNKKRNRNTIEGKFVELQRAGLDAVAANLSVFGEASHVAKEKIYVVEMKISNNHKLKVVLDKDLAFKGYQFEPFKWLDARLKCRRPASSRSSDVDMRIIMSTQRDLTTEEYENLSIHETFGKIPILSLVDGRLTIAQEYRRRATFVFITEVDTQSLIYNDSCIFLEVKKIKRYNAKQMRSTPEKEFTSLKLYVADSNVDSTEKLVKDILSLGKILKPSA